MLYIYCIVLHISLLMYIDVYALYSSTDHKGTKDLNDISDDGESEEEICESCVSCLRFVIMNITLQRSKWLISFFPMFSTGKVVYFICEMSNKWAV